MVVEPAVLRRFGFSFFVLILALMSSARAAEEPAAAVSIPEMLTAGALPSLKPARFGDFKEALHRFYATGDFAPVWMKDGKPTAKARQALALLELAESHGLEPADYSLAELEKRVEHPRPAQAAETDVALSAALFLFLSDLHGGRVNPRQLNFDINLLPRRLDLPVLVREALAKDRLPTLAEQVEPRFGVYGRLRQALATYRQMALQPFTPLPVVKKLQPGQNYPALAALARRFTELGDLPAGSPLPLRYDGVLADAMKRFQARHGLVADGVAGRGTFEQLNTTPARRVRQIALAMERFRWLRIPESASNKVIAVNIPEFRLRALALEGGRLENRLSMDVIVGKALDTRTPVFHEDMLYIDFKPYWNVPSSIAKGELLPKLEKNPGYLAKENMEFVPVAGGAAVTAVTPATLAAVARGAMRIRQRPGGKNALGDIKFVLPNNMNIYLHHTASPSLFKKARRDLSHGCIRVEDPVALAKFVLEDQPAWTSERIKAAMDADKPSTVHLLHPVPVIIFYATAVAEADGRVLFLPDLYGLDESLDAALKQRAARLAAP